jgi:hypothetical protein
VPFTMVTTPLMMDAANTHASCLLLRRHCTLKVELDHLAMVPGHNIGVRRQASL